jgi:hypothetical protein
VLVEQMVVLRDVLVVEVGDAEIKENVEQKSEVHQGGIPAIFFRSHGVLHGTVDAKNPERLYQQVQEEQEGKVGNELALHDKRCFIKVKPYNEGQK